MDNQEKKAEVANTALSRLIAGDFLESLGKELGIEVPPDMPYPKQKSKNIATRKELVNEEDTRIETLDSKNNDEISLNHDLLYDQQIAQEGGLSKSFTIHGNNRENSNVKTKGVSNMNYKPDRSELNINDVRKIKSPLVPNHDYSSSSEEEKSRKRSSREKYEEYRKLKTPVTHRRNYSSSSSLEEEKSRKRSRHHGHKRRDAGSDSFSDDERRDRHSSRSKEKKGSSREKSRSEKHSKHRKHRKHESRNSNEKDNSRSRSEKKRRE